MNQKTPTPSSSPQPETPAQMDKVFTALASSARRQILAYLDGGELSAGDIAERFDFSKPALSGHLRLLEDAGLVVREKRGQFVYVRLVRERLANTVFSWAAELCPVARPLKREARARQIPKDAP
jgi:ArsR family transcriptional regulator, arsenate/arsenite/antimonite-responsive transcriptional repressor